MNLTAFHLSLCRRISDAISASAHTDLRERALSFAGSTRPPTAVSDRGDDASDRGSDHYARFSQVIEPPAARAAGFGNVRFLSRGLRGAWCRFVVSYAVLALACTLFLMSLDRLLWPLIVDRERVYWIWVVGSSVVSNLFFLTFLYAPLPPQQARTLPAPPPQAEARTALASAANGHSTADARMPFLAEDGTDESCWRNDPAFLRRIGIVVPCHKSAEEIGATLESLLRYFEPHHICVCDNGNNLSPWSQDRCATQRVVRQAYLAYLEALPESERAGKKPIHYYFIPEGHKTQALCVGALKLDRMLETGPDGETRRAIEYIMHIDDDTILSDRMVFDESLFKDDAYLAAVAFPRSSPKTNVVTASVDFWYKKADHMGWAQAQTSGTRPYIPGPVGASRPEPLSLSLSLPPSDALRASSKETHDRAA